MIVKHKRHNTQQGISLIEVLISLVLLSVGVLGLIRLQIYVEQQSSFANQSFSALKLADEKMDMFRTRGATAGSVTSIPYASITSGSSVHTPYTLTWTVTDQHIGAPAPGGEPDGAKLIAMTVKWKDRMKTEHTITLTSMVSKYSEFD